MPVVLEDVVVFEFTEGINKKGEYYASIVLLNMEHKKKIDAFLKNEELAKQLKEFCKAGEVISLKALLVQKYGNYNVEFLEVA